MTQEQEGAVKARTTLSDSLARLAQRLSESQSLRPGTVIFRLTGLAEGHYCLECSEGKAILVEAGAAGFGGQPIVEVIGDADTIRAILDGKKNAKMQFFAGGIRVRGDLRYLSDKALELGILDAPL